MSSPPSGSPAYRLQRLGRGLRYFLLQLLEPHGLTPEQYGILARLGDEDGLPQSALVDPAFDDRANVTHLVNQLAKGRLVERRTDEGDRRRRRVWLTDTGRSLLARLRSRVEQATDGLFEDLDDRQTRQLLEWVDRIEARMQRM